MTRERCKGRNYHSGNPTILRFGLPVGGVDIGAQELLTAMLQDKKRSGGEHRFVLMRALGEAFVASAEDSAIAEAIEYITK